MVSQHEPVSLLSIRQLTRRNILALLVVLLLLMLGLFLGLRGYLSEQNRQSQLNRLGLQAENITHVIQLYRDVVGQLSEQSLVSDLIQFAEVDEAHDWARKTQRLLPESLGLALFDEDGKLLGNPMQLRLGESCVLDMHQFLSGQVLPGPRVHDKVRKLAHFDISEPVRTNEGIVGVVFASFSLSTIQRVLRHITVKGQALTVLSYDNQVIAHTDILSSAHPVSSYTIPISGTNWRLSAVMEKPESSWIFIYMGMLGVVLILLPTMTFLVFSRKLSRVFVGEVTAIQRLIQSLYTGGNVQQYQPRLQETEGIFTGIKILADEISQYQQRLKEESKTDELTGLSNRRALREKMPSLMMLARRGISVCVVVLDLDYFKSLNDRYGHALGDQVLQQFAACLRDNTYDIDLCVRLGGDEFVVALVKCDIEQVESWFARLLNAFLQQQLDVLDIPESQCCCLSAGVVILDNADRDVDDILEKADVALYQAKNQGRGKIQTYTPDSSVA